MTIDPQRQFESLVSPNLHLLKGFVKRRVQGSAEADDVVQQTLLLALSHIGQFRFEASFGTWLCCIAMNEIRSRVRRPEFSRTILAAPQMLDNLDIQDPVPSAFTSVARDEEKAQLHRAVLRLPDIYRVIVKLRDFDGLSIRETADSLRVSVPAVKSRHRRARLILRKILSEERSTPPLAKCSSLHRIHR